MSGYRSIISALLETPAPQNIATAAQPAGAIIEPEASQPGPVSDPAPEKDKPMAINTDSEDYKAGVAASTEATRKAERVRFTAVTGSEHYAGREKLASNLLGTDMSADAIIAALADAPLAASAAADGGEGQQEAADQALMRERLQSRNPDLGNDDAEEDAGAKAKADNYGWGKAHATVAKRYGRKAAK